MRRDRVGVLLVIWTAALVVLTVAIWLLLHRPVAPPVDVLPTATHVVIVITDPTPRLAGSPRPHRTKTPTTYAPDRLPMVTVTRVLTDTPTPTPEPPTSTPAPVETRGPIQRG